MKFVSGRVDITPVEPIWQAGYVERKHVFDDVNDPITATVFVLTVKNSERIVWVSADIGGGKTPTIDHVLELCREKGVIIEKDHLVFGGTHTHSGPQFEAGRIGQEERFTEKEKAYAETMCQKIADLIVELYNKEGEEVITRYSDVLIDGCYSNRNDKNKMSDKHEYMIGFFNKEDKLVGVYHLMSHHCTVLGSHNYHLSADLFGALRRRLEPYFGCYFLMAQGNAGDMGNKQYREGNDVPALEKHAENIYKQIVNKFHWYDIDIDGFEHKNVSYTASFHVDYSEYKELYEQFKARLEVATNVDDIKLLTGWVANAKRKKDLPPEDIVEEMKAEIVRMNELEIFLVPGEYGSILGLRCKAASKAKLAFVWAYCNGCDLGYMVEKEAFATESQESRSTRFPAGICDEYTQVICDNVF